MVHGYSLLIIACCNGVLFQSGSVGCLPQKHIASVFSEYYIIFLYRLVQKNVPFLYKQISALPLTLWTAIYRRTGSGDYFWLSFGLVLLTTIGQDSFGHSWQPGCISRNVPQRYLLLLIIIILVVVVVVLWVATMTSTTLKSTSSQFLIINRAAKRGKNAGN